MIWNPIESAPKDGTLVLFGSKDNFEVGAFVDGEPCINEYDGDNNWVGLYFTPTHWASLEPPQ